jgi:pectin lyase
MRFELIAILAVAATTAAQSVVGTAYGYGAGATGGGSAKAVTPTTNEQLATSLSDDTPRVILLTKTFDFTGKKATGPGCDKSICSAKSGGGQYYLGDLSCGGGDMTAVSSISYDVAGNTMLKVDSNKSILSVGAKGVPKGKGLSIAKDASNVIIQGVEFTTINPVSYGAATLSTCREETPRFGSTTTNSHSSAANSSYPITTAPRLPFPITSSTASPPHLLLATATTTGP